MHVPVAYIISGEESRAETRGPGENFEFKKSRYFGFKKLRLWGCKGLNFEFQGQGL
jgi:hypothetical protein